MVSKSSWDVGTLMSDGFPKLLRDSIWHTTRPDRFEAILRSGAILANPEIPNNERWKTSRGPDYYPYVRHIGGVSLFDFRGFDPVSYSEACPMSSWRTFVPLHEGWPASIWLKIDTRRVNGEYVEARDLWERQHREGAHRHTLMPRIEAAVIGSIPLSAIESAYIISKGNDDLELFEFQH